MRGNQTTGTPFSRRRRRHGSHNNGRRRSGCRAVLYGAVVSSRRPTPPICSDLICDRDSLGEIRGLTCEHPARVSCLNVGARPKEDQMVTSVRQMLETANAAVPKITPDQASDMIKKGNTLVVDVRDAPEVSASGKIAGAVNVSRGMLEFRADPDSPYHENNFDKEKTVILYCASGGRSALAGKVLKDMGYDKVYNVGGFKDWTGAKIELGRVLLPGSLIYVASLQKGTPHNRKAANWAGLSCGSLALVGTGPSRRNRTRNNRPRWALAARRNPCSHRRTGSHRLASFLRTGGRTPGK